LKLQFTIGWQGRQEGLKLKTFGSQRFLKGSQRMAVLLFAQGKVD